MSTNKGRVPKEKRAKIRLTWDDFDDAIIELTEQIRNKGIPVDSVFGIPRGGLVVAVALSHALKVPLVMNPFAKPFTLVCDDTCDSGETLAPYIDNWEFPTATIYYNADAIVKPKFYVWKQFENEWIVFPWECE